MTPQDLWIDAVRTSHERFRGVLDRVDPGDYERGAYPDEWSIAQVASHLGSQAEIFGLYLDAGLDDGVAPTQDAFQQVWARWDAMEPSDQVSESVAANDRFVDRLEQVAASGAPFEVDLFGRPADLAGVAAARLAEHAVHTWDVEVVLDPTTGVAPGAVDLLVDRLPDTVAFAGRPADAAPTTVVVGTSDPARRFRLEVGDEAVSLAPLEHDVEHDVEPDVRLPAEALVRLVYGRLDAATTPDDVEGGDHLPALRTAFPGF